MTIETNRESRARRLLAKDGYRLKKTPSRAKARDVLGVGYMIIDENNLAVSGAWPLAYSDTLDDVEAFISS